MIVTTKPSLKEKQWKLREDSILDAASELMISKGYNAMTMDDISNLVGISKATLYQHFNSKHDLVVSVACRTVDRAYDLMVSIDPNLPANERLAQLIDRIVAVRYGSDSPPYIEAVGEIVEILGADHPFMQKERRNIALVTQVMTDAKAQGALGPGISIVVAVHILMSALRCIELERSIEKGETSPEEISGSIKLMLIHTK